MSRDEEKLSWDVEGEDGNKGKEGDSVLHGDGTNRLNVEEMHESAEEGSKEEKRGDLLQSKGDDSVEESKVGKNKDVVEKMIDGTKKSINEQDKRNDSGVDCDKKVIMESKLNDGKDSLVANKHSENEKEEEDLEWDEIEDLSRIDEENVGFPEYQNRLRRPLFFNCYSYGRTVSKLGPFSVHVQPNCATFSNNP